VGAELHGMLGSPVSGGGLKSCAIRLVLHGDFGNQRIIYRRVKQQEASESDAMEEN
jgi:hypothetical protein